MSSTTSKNKDSLITTPEKKNDVLQKIEHFIRMEMTKSTVEVKTETKNFEQMITEYVQRAHELKMASIQNMTLLAESRLLDVNYVRRNTLRDPSLKEGGCQFVFRTRENEHEIDSIIRLFTLIYRPRNASISDYLLPYIHCSSKDCSIFETIKRHFEDVREEINLEADISKRDQIKWKLRQPIIVACCQRHQHILENIEGVSIPANIARRFDKYVVTLNVVYNGFYVDGGIPIANPSKPRFQANDELGT